MLTERALRRVAALRPAPDVVIITGDLTDCGLASEYELLAGMLRRNLSMPVYVVPGNHDRREVLLASLPGTRSMAGGFVQYAVDLPSARIVMLDTVVPGAGHGELCQQRLDWLDRTLAEKPDAPTLIGMHHPPFRCGIAHMDSIALREPGPLHRDRRPPPSGAAHRLRPSSPPGGRPPRAGDRLHRAERRAPGRVRPLARRPGRFRLGAQRLRAASLGSRHWLRQPYRAGRRLPRPVSRSSPTRTTPERRNPACHRSSTL